MLEPLRVSSCWLLQTLETSTPKAILAHVKGARALASAGNALRYTKKHGLTLGWGTDLLDSAEECDQQLKGLTMRTDYRLTSAEVMIQATGNGSKTVAICGKLNPYGKVGVVKIVEDYETMVTEHPIRSKRNLTTPSKTKTIPSGV
jgi:hypothetical protein